MYGVCRWKSRFCGYVVWLMMKGRDSTVVADGLGQRKRVLDKLKYGLATLCYQQRSPFPYAARSSYRYNVPVIEIDIVVSKLAQSNAMFVSR